VRRQVLDAMQFVLTRQLRDDNLWLAPDPAVATGGMPQSDVPLSPCMGYANVIPKG